MILQALYERYVDLSQDPDSGISARFFSSVDVSFILQISLAGELLNIVDIRETVGRKLRPMKMIVPEQGVRSSGVKPYYLCDKLEYLIGLYTLNDKLTAAKKAKQVQDAAAKYESSALLHKQLLEDSIEESAIAITRFFTSWNPSQVRDHPVVVPLLDSLDKSTNQVAIFEVKGQIKQFVHQHESIRSAWIAFKEQESMKADRGGQCLITGAFNQPIARIHDMKIKGVRNAQSSGAALVSFNISSFESYNKEKSFNAPVSEQAVFAYTTALNHLLASESNRMTNMGDMTVVFWSGSNHKIIPSEEIAKFTQSFFVYDPDPTEVENDQDQNKLIYDLWSRVQRGDELTEDMVQALHTPFYVLGLSPNNARLGVRFFWKGDLQQLIYFFRLHATDLEIEQGYSQYRFPIVTRMLLETVRKGDKDVWKSISPSLGGQLFRSVIEGKPYPYLLFTSVLNRIKIEGEINSTRAAILKAYLARYARVQHNESLKEVITVGLNEQTQDVAYRLGRLFAVLEKAQQDAAGGPKKLNSTIKDRYFASAASTPANVFPVLLKLAQHHISKSKYGSFRDGEIEKIMSGMEVTEFPKYFNLHKQGVFMLGYYHQKNFMYKKGEDKDE
ncbi:type I-C CRISPR-associated protein Cas8c/Csd1 [Paenibacillus sp. 481]|uniref:type I-C CRISPR-associated protein Cas8c/Csd1 n=1 Tax=Paenibacillus sp. 481 TaxID=2835869 RepID=UPI001E43CA81|nr:type I-C CRISPR-associated protein Cas8c/Csd1 [Paenibacillus sp. 481]UHA71863.1 type I-C CRISPR-associated protein Cas8c/Csd1 [Paenibacillus sp. 481]